jgi:hypothetical protein
MLYYYVFLNKFAVDFSDIINMKVIRYKPQPPKVPAWAQEALMKY